MTQSYLLHTLGRRIEAFPTLREHLWGLEAQLVERAWRKAAACDIDTASDFGAKLGRWLGPRSYKNQHVLGNLSVAFPHLLPHQVADLALKVWESIGRTLIEYPLLERICDPAENRIRVVDLGGLEAIRASGRPAVFVSAHVGNFNLLALAATRSAIPLTVVYRRQTNPSIERLMSRWRTSIGCRFLEVGEATRPLLQELRTGRSVGLIMDQRYDRGVKVPFFGRPATTTLVPARLAVRLDLPLVPARVVRLRGARFSVMVQPPVERPTGLDEEEAALAMTTTVNAQFARWIAARPEEWLCAKRRWPRQRARLPGGGKISLT